jgi:membrane-associated phospholipid phosphatase
VGLKTRGGTVTPVRFAAIAATVIIAAHLIDGWAYSALAHPRVYDGDLGRMLRVMGFVPLWAAAALALALHDWPRLRRGALLLGAPIAGGIGAELLKLLLRRERPWAHDGEYVFRAFSERPFSTGGLALPSSHAMVAFAAAAMLARLFPRATPVWWALAIGCGITRVMAGAHFVSDVAVAALAGWLVAAGLWRVAAGPVIIGGRGVPERSGGSASSAAAPEQASSSR